MKALPQPMLGGPMVGEYLFLALGENGRLDDVRDCIRYQIRKS